MAKVSIPQGVLKGGKAKSVNGLEYYEFLGVPYAKPPIGESRFKSPQLPEPWIGERDATNIIHSNVCCQLDFVDQSFIGSEDCLYLNVYTPELPRSSEKLLPVMVYLHEGGFAFGSGIDKNNCGPDFLIEKNVVIVTINYRLHVFGFLSLDIPEAAGNMGLKDQVKALEWVKRNIEYFNGDRENVTIFGTSAGAVSVDYHLLSPASEGLFHKAISHSGSILNSWSINNTPRESLNLLLQNLDYKGSLTDQKEIYKFLMKIAAEEIVIANSKISSDVKHLHFSFVPIIENNFNNGESFITEHPYKLFRMGKFNKVPVLTGFCDKEVSLRTMIGNHAVEELINSNNFVQYLPYDLQIEDRELYNSKLKKYYLDDNHSEEAIEEAVMNFLSDVDFISGIWTSAKMMARAGVPLFIFEFTYTGELNYSRIIQINVDGAGHGDINGYLLSTQMSEEINESDALMIQRITNLWSNFARSSNPTPTTSDIIPLSWPAFTNESLAYFNIDKEIKVKIDYEPEKMALFEELYDKYIMQREAIFE